MRVRKTDRDSIPLLVVWALQSCPLTRPQFAVEKFCKHMKKICCCCRREEPPHCCLLLLASSYYLSPSFMWHSKQFKVKLSRLACCYPKLFSRLIYLSVCHFIMMVLQHRTTLFVAITKRRLYAETQQQFRQHGDCKHFLTRNLFYSFRC